ncbi:carbonic anhydrase [Catenovulum agarivorans]|uniref:carbonic anhydrase n=1 Tax=Catenovulum agarivorans TaxID=1172192 RepID=UPI0002D3E8FA|nr:carbonic anhydrase [Catenovulum agarivorans]
MEEIVRGVKKFQQHGYPERKALFKELANGQSPEVLFITCADSRIDPNLLTNAEPGDLFICRNAGNVVPPHSNATGGMTASIEFAVTILGVKHIVICGHTDCGAMRGVIDPAGLDAVPHVKNWLGHCRAAGEIVKAKYGKLEPAHMNDVIEANVVMQMLHLKTHPAVAVQLAQKTVSIHGWVYDIKNGKVKVYNELDDIFVSLEQAYPEFLDK